MTTARCIEAEGLAPVQSGLERAAQDCFYALDASGSAISRAWLISPTSPDWRPLRLGLSLYRSSSSWGILARALDATTRRGLLGVLIEYADPASSTKGRHGIPVLLHSPVADRDGGIIIIWSPVGMTSSAPSCAAASTSASRLPEVPALRHGRRRAPRVRGWLFLEKTRYGAIMRAGSRTRRWSPSRIDIIALHRCLRLAACSRDRGALTARHPRG